MASLRTKKTRTGTSYIVCFRFGDRLYNRSLGEVTPGEAEARKKRVEATIYDINIGRLTVPPAADAGLFILSDGKLAEKLKAVVQDEPVTLKKLWEQYKADLPEGAKERSSQKTEALHVKHLLSLLGESTAVTALTVKDLQGYIGKRSRQKGFRGKVKPRTVKKELGTLRMLWNTFALPRKIVTVDYKSHFGKLLYDKEKEKPPFQTFSQIERQIARGGLNADQIAALWDGLFLDAGQVKEVLEHVSGIQWAPAWVYPMFVLAAMTGARRSEMIRSRLADWDDRHNRTGHFRERKRSSETTTRRMVTVVPQVAQALDAYLLKHPGGEFLFSDEADVRLTPKSADYWFGRVLEGSKWSVLRGWHVFRHSFASVLAARGIDQRIIDGTLGHQTEAMKERYRHLFPQVQEAAFAAVFGS